MVEIDSALQFVANPRKISGTQLNKLKNDLERFGDLGGVIYCRNHKAYVGGNQRSKIFDGAKIRYIEKYENPREDKTVAIGLIEWNGRNYMYREVEFSDEEFREACIVANNDGGEWNTEILSKEWDKFELEEYGFDISKFEDLFSDNDEEMNIMSDDFEPTTGLNYLKFGPYKIQISDEELAGLNNKAEEYFNINGTLVGFASTII